MTIGAYGQSLSPVFFLKPSYWRGSSDKGPNDHTGLLQDNNGSEHYTGTHDEALVEPVPAAMRGRNGIRYYYNLNLLSQSQCIYFILIGINRSCPNTYNLFSCCILKYTYLFFLLLFHKNSQRKEDLLGERWQTRCQSSEW